MWTGQNTKGKVNDEDLSLLGKNARFKGAIMFEGTARIDGYLEGDISTEGILVIGEHAVVEGNIAAKSVHCAGKVTGDIVASERVDLVAPALVRGRVKSPRLSLQEGVSFLGISEVQNPALALARQSDVVEAPTLGTTHQTLTCAPDLPHQNKRLIPWGSTGSNPAPSSTAIGE